MEGGPLVGFCFGLLAGGMGLLFTLSLHVDLTMMSERGCSHYFKRHGQNTGQLGDWHRDVFIGWWDRR